MSLSEIEVARVDKIVGGFVERRRPPAHIRSQLDFGFRLKGQSVELYEIRPVWRGGPGEMMEHGIAKATYVRSRALWRVFWLRQDLKWHSYEPVPEVGTLEKFVEVVEKDAYACFFG
jgi:hypothetical protein